MSRPVIVGSVASSKANTKDVRARWERELYEISPYLCDISERLVCDTQSRPVDSD